MKNQGMTIGIAPGHLGPFAGEDHAHELIGHLKRLEWPVSYVSNMEGLIWHFDSIDSFKAFSADFEVAVDAMSNGQAGYWIVQYEQKAGIAVGVVGEGAFRLQIGGE